MNSHPLQQQSNSDFQSPNQMSYNNNDLQFTTSVDTSVRQNVPIPAIVPPSQITQPPTSHDSHQSDTVLSTLYKNSAHPIPCIFHCLFKTIALAVYILSGLLNHERFIITTVTCLVFLSMDFWVVKNVTGRLLVGLRWWSQNVGEDGTEHKWIFESHEDSTDKPNNKFDQTFFWTVLYVTPVLWTALFLSTFFRLNLKWLITVLFGMALSTANTYGYYQCSRDQKAKWERMMVRGAEITAFSAIRNSTTLNRFGDFASRLVGFGTSNVPNGVSAGGGGASYANANLGQSQQIPSGYGQPLQHV